MDRSGPRLVFRPSDIRTIWPEFAHCSYLLAKSIAHRRGAFRAGLPDAELAVVLQSGTRREIRQPVTLVDFLDAMLESGRATL